MTPDTNHGISGAASDAGRLQTLFVRLLFCDHTYERYCADQSSLANEFGVDIDALSDLPDPGTPQLIAERHGRKMGVLGEVRKTFARGYGLIAALPGYHFEDFLCSDAFFDDTSGLPHPHGVGPGYENASKFFFWSRNTLDLNGSSERQHARLMLNGDFAAYLIGQRNRGAEGYFQRFADGAYWREDTSRPLPVILMTTQLAVYRIAEEAPHQNLLAKAIDLDTLTPEPPPNRTI